MLVIFCIKQHMLSIRGLSRMARVDVKIALMKGHSRVNPKE